MELTNIMNKRILFIIFSIVETIEIVLSLILIIKPPQNVLRFVILACLLCNIILSINYILDNFNLLKTFKDNVINNYYTFSIGLCIILIITTCVYIYYLANHMVTAFYFILLLFSNICNVLIITLIYYYIYKYKERTEGYDEL